MNTGAKITKIHAADSSLLVLDVQQKLVPLMPVPSVGPSFINRIEALIHLARLLEVPVHITEQYPKGLGPTVPAVRACLPAGCEIYEKTCFSAWGQAALREKLCQGEPRTLLLAGVETHICIAQTALDFREAGWRVGLVVDGCESRHASDKALTLGRLQHSGIVCLSLEALAYEWMRDSTHPHFRQAQQILKRHTS